MDLRSSRHQFWGSHATGEPIDLSAGQKVDQKKCSCCRLFLLASPSDWSTSRSFMLQNVYIWWRCFTPPLFPVTLFPRHRARGDPTLAEAQGNLLHHWSHCLRAFLWGGILRRVLVLFISTVTATRAAVAKVSWILRQRIQLLNFQPWVLNTSATMWLHTSAHTESYTHNLAKINASKTKHTVLSFR
jgi:hypothetical protein